MHDVIIIGAGLSGLTAASLLAKRGIQVTVIDKSYNPGGSCGAFKRNDIIYDQGSAMLFGFGDKGFNSHRFVFNCLEEPINMVKHDTLYCVNYRGKRIRFWADIDEFVVELSRVFPTEAKNIKRFYKDLNKMYKDVMIENPIFATADENDGKDTLKGIIKHPISHAKFLGFMNKNTKSLLEKYFTDPEIFNFFDKLTSTYCYTTVEETPAVLSAVMFVDNHTGGSYYPVGSTLFLPGKLEKVIEENNGIMVLGQEVVQIIFKDDKPAGVKLGDGTILYSNDIIYSGTVWNLYNKLLPNEHVTEEKKKWVNDLEPTYPSVILYAHVKEEVIPRDTEAIEMLVGNPNKLDESEITVYILSIDDRTICNDKGHVIMTIGPSFQDWKDKTPSEYREMKKKEEERLLNVLEKRFPNIKENILHVEVATPRTIEKYLNKNNGYVAGPKQKIGQHMFKRMHTKSQWENLYCCGESTTMGTGTPTVTISGISAANAILKKRNIEEFKYKPNMKNYVKIVDKPKRKEDLYKHLQPDTREIVLEASKCQYCEYPTCSKNEDIRGMMRRTTVENFTGAKKIAKRIDISNIDLIEAREKCIRNKLMNSPIDIEKIVSYLIEI